ncbi:MAG: TolC family protein [Owenweeksia sp.]|nr:TolC family protein [Owenweeksia sp.]
MKRILTFLLLMAALAGWSQQSISFESLLDTARSQNINLQQLKLEVERTRRQNQPHAGIGSTQLQYNFGEVDGPAQDYQVQIQQNLGNPLAGIKQFKVQKAAVKNSELQLELKGAWLQQQLLTAYAGWYSHWQILQTQLELKNSFKAAIAVAQKQLEAGEISKLEVGFARGRYLQATQNATQARQQMLQFQSLLEVLSAMELSDFQPGKLEMPIAIPQDTLTSLYEQFYNSQMELARQQKQKSMTNFFPSLFVGYTNQQLDYIPGYEFYTLGARIPLFDVSTYQNRQLSVIDFQQAEMEKNLQLLRMKSRLGALREQREQILKSLSETDLKPNDLSEDLRLARKRYELGEIDMLELSQSLDALAAAYISQQKLMQSLYEVQAEILYLTAR